MPVNQNLKRRIKSAGSIKKITRAMEAVSASKMARSQKKATIGIDYNMSLWKMIQNIIGEKDAESMFLNAINPTAKKLFILIGSDRGLCGAFNTNLLRTFDTKENEDAAVITLGRKMTDYSKNTSWQVISAIDKLGDFPESNVTTGISQTIIDEFLAGNISSATIIYQKFINTLKSEVTYEQILPVTKPVADTNEKSSKKYIFEPNPKELLDEMLRYSINVKIFGAILLSKAAEQSARMVAMKNATKSSEELRDKLQRVYNKEYQKSITSEISDVVTASLAIKK